MVVLVRDVVLVVLVKPFLVEVAAVLLASSPIQLIQPIKLIQL